jgi:hypothetical protein
LFAISVDHLDFLSGLDRESHRFTGWYKSHSCFDGR